MLNRSVSWYFRQRFSNPNFLCSRKSSTEMFSEDHFEGVTYFFNDNKSFTNLITLLNISVRVFCRRTYNHNNHIRNTFTDGRILKNTDGGCNTSHRISRYNSRPYICNLIALIIKLDCYFRQVTKYY